MKVSKIPGLGRFGVFIDDIDFNTITQEEWAEVGKIHLNSLVTIIRNTNLTPDNYMKFMHQWGTPRWSSYSELLKKYNKSFAELMQMAEKNDTTLSERDAQFIRNVSDFMVKDRNGGMTEVLKVTGKRKANGDPLGMFAEGELLWHSNESGTLTFTPGVSLLANEGVVGSATGFLTTTDWYEKQSEAFRSELDEMVILHRFTPGKINPGLRSDQDYVMYRNMCPIDDTRIPLVMGSPAGITGLHYSINTVYQVEGMSVAESQKLFDRINKELFVDEYTYDHWYQNNNDLCLFDNSITLHRRLGGIANRLCYRIQYDYTRLQDGPYIPYFQDEFNREYRREIREIVKTIGITDFKLPKVSFIESVKDMIAQCTSK
jgi:alpha-ketoglutarate-dependent taurine dioxygenase